MNPKTEKESPKLVVWPDSRLTRKADPVTAFSSVLIQDIIDLYWSLKELNGLGLSACQLTDLPNIAVLVYKVGDREGVMVNPKIIGDSAGLKHTSHEGCLSFPGVYVEVERFNHITVQWQDDAEEHHEEQLTGLLGDCIQHEIDHLNGRTIIDYLSRLKRDVVTRKMKKLQKRLERVSHVNQRAVQRALRGPDATSGEGIIVPRGGRDSRLHRLHLPSE